MAYLNHNIPPFGAQIRDEYMYNHQKGHKEFTECEVHSITSIRRRAVLFEAILDNGVNWTRRPITAFCWKEDAPIRPIHHHMYWDCFSHYPDVQVRERLKFMRADLLTVERELLRGTYMFTIDWGHENAAMLDTDFSEDPEHKCAHMFKMDEGNFFAYPNNRIVWEDDAFIGDRLKVNPGYKIDQTIYTIEDKREHTETDDSYLTEFIHTSIREH